MIKGLEYAFLQRKFTNDHWDTIKDVRYHNYQENAKLIYRNITSYVLELLSAKNDKN